MPWKTNIASSLYNQFTTSCPHVPWLGWPCTAAGAVQGRLHSIVQHGKLYGIIVRIGFPENRSDIWSNCQGTVQSESRGSARPDRASCLDRQPIPIGLPDRADSVCGCRAQAILAQAFLAQALQIGLIPAPDWLKSALALVALGATLGGTRR